MACSDGSAAAIALKAAHVPDVELDGGVCGSGDIDHAGLHVESYYEKRRLPGYPHL
jgi:hypothetical protein